MIVNDVALAAERGRAEIDATKTVVVETPLGPFRFALGDNMGRWLAVDAPDAEAAHVGEAIRRLVKPGMVVADIGANVGYYTRLLAKLVGPTGEVHAIEPVPSTFQLLRENCPEAQVVPYCLAALDENKAVSIHLDVTSSGGASLLHDAPFRRGESLQVPARRLGEILPPLDFALIDVQGYDHLALAGLSPHLPPKAIVEYTPEWIGGVDPRDVYVEMGYAISEIGDTSAGHWDLILIREDNP